MSRFFAFAALAFWLLAPAAALGQRTPDVQGTWRGEIEAPGQRIGVAFHLREGEDGTLTATLDVPAQGARGIPVSEVRQANDSLRLAVPAAGITVEGVVAPDGERIDATWQQGGVALPLVLTKGPAEEDASTAPEEPDEAGARRQPGEPDVRGRWAGRIGGTVGLRLVFEIEEQADGTLTAMAESPDQGGQPFPTSAVALHGDTLRVEVAVVGASFEGRVDGDTVEGTFRQGGAPAPLTLTRGADEALRRPQEPAPPFPYEHEDVRFEGGAGTPTLAGTLTLPSGAGPHPVVVLVSGSGPQNRDEELLGHKPFLVLADYLTRRGVAVLRYDERGVGESTGDFSSATTHTFASDARAALAYLRSREDLRLGERGIIGHSEGGLVAPMVATHHPGEVDFMVLLAGPGVPGGEVLAEQAERVALSQGATPEQAATNRATQARLMDAVATAPDSATAAERVQALLQEAGQSEAQARAGAQGLTTPWRRAFIAYDPRPALRELDVPVLALLAEKDIQVTPAQNEPALRAALADNADATVRVFDGLNHLFQTAETGSVDEYGEIEETIAPQVLQAVADWILERTGAK